MIAAANATDASIITNPVINPKATTQEVISCRRLFNATTVKPICVVMLEITTGYFAANARCKADKAYADMPHN